MIHRSKGFTMTELAVVIVITIVLSTLLAPRFLTGMRESKLRSAVQTTKTALNFARQFSITSRDEIAVSAVAPGSRLILLNVETGDTVRVYTLPDGVTISSITASPHYFPRGLVVPTGTIQVSTTSDSKNVIVNIHGRVRVEDV